MRDKEIVRQGYDTIAARYLATRSEETADVQLLPELAARLPRGAAVLDAGCGAGVPISKLLSREFRVTGIDLSMGQLRLARELVPEARFVCEDMARPAFRDGAFDAICSYYAIIHVPREEHRAVLIAFHRLLRPGGLALLCLGAEDLPHDMEEDYLGAPMMWSHFDAATNLLLLAECGFDVIWQWLIPDSQHPAAAHLFVLARRRT